MSREHWAALGLTGGLRASVRVPGSRRPNGKGDHEGSPPPAAAEAGDTRTSSDLSYGSRVGLSLLCLLVPAFLSLLCCHLFAGPPGPTDGQEPQPRLLLPC